MIKAIETGWLHPTINHVGALPSFRIASTVLNCLTCLPYVATLNEVERVIAIVAMDAMLHGSTKITGSKFAAAVVLTSAPLHVQDDPMEELKGIDCVPNVKQQHTVTAAISNSFAFGGHNSAVCFAPFQQ